MTARTKSTPADDSGVLPVLPRSVRVASVVAVTAVIVYFSLLDAAVPPTGPPSPWWDKQLHIAAYAALTLSASQATVEYRALRWRRIVGVVAFAIGFGIAIELAQYPLPDRYAGFGDVLANAVGTGLAAVVFAIEARLGYADD